jgi:hypothetical protein
MTSVVRIITKLHAAYKQTTALNTRAGQRHGYTTYLSEIGTQGTTGTDGPGLSLSVAAAS